MDTLSVHAEPVIIRPYAPADKDAFRQLNMDWIQTYFRMEDEDYHELDHPGEIISRGGAILIAARGKEAIGCCALIPKDAECCEFAKLAVTPKARGLHIGWKLGCAAVNTARGKGFKRLYLESNTKLTPAISLYRKLGFRRIPDQPSAFQRCDIQMELDLLSASQSS